MPKQGDQILPGWHVERVVSAIASNGGAEQRHATRVEGGQGLLELEQVGTLIFAVAKLEQGAVRLPTIDLADIKISIYQSRPL
jgi:hypothetical protein